MKIMRKYRYTIIAVFALISCLVYNSYGDTKSRSKQRSLEPLPLIGETVTGETDIDPSIAIDFSLVGTVEKINGVDEQLLSRASYIVSYNKETKCPNWVAWRLTADHANGDVSRMGNAFHEDMDVPVPRALNADYRKSGYSRGHMCPAGDNKWDREAMYETFLLSNVCPQNANLNSGLWNQIEISCRRWAETYGDIYIICGPMFFRSKEMQYIGENAVAIPDAFFKVILCLNDAPKCIGFVCRNTDGNKKKDMYVNTLNEVERLTGLHFFPQLGPEIRTLVEDHADINEW